MTTPDLDFSRRTYEGGLIGDDALHNFTLALSVERWFFHEHHVEDDPYCPDIALFIVFLQEDFGGDVVGSPDARA
jgi:hypothetical protein